MEYGYRTDVSLYPPEVSVNSVRVCSQIVQVDHDFPPSTCLAWTCTCIALANSLILAAKQVPGQDVRLGA